MKTIGEVDYSKNTNLLEQVTNFYLQSLGDFFRNICSVSLEEWCTREDSNL